ncbi:MAG: ABC transporter permease [Candidatus Limnocylindrales bacterium]|jgi:putative ABC transport system permease protein
MRLVRDLGRRKLRSGLTITGIAIGIMALVVFGSMANKMNALIGGGSKYYADKAVVSVGNMYSGNFQPLSLADLDRIRNVEGVAAATPGIEMMLSDSGGATMGMPEMIGGFVPGGDKGLETFKLDVSSGRKLTAEDSGNVAVLGCDLARKLNASVGGKVTLRDVEFTVVGILAPTLTAPDKEAEVPLDAAQQLFIKTLPPMVQSKINASDIATSITVYPKPGVDPETLKANLKAVLGSDYTVMTGKDFDAMLGSFSAIFSLVLTGIAMLSLLVGGLSTINTMAMSVAERTREIGIKRAIGSSRWRIRREIVLESAAIGLIAGLIGLAIGAVMTNFFNDLGRSSGNVLFDLTLGTAVTAIAFSTGLGAIAGFVPAWGASRLDPVTALRYE